MEDAFWFVSGIVVGVFVFELYLTKSGAIDIRLRRWR